MASGKLIWFYMITFFLFIFFIRKDSFSLTVFENVLIE